VLSPHNIYIHIYIHTYLKHIYIYIYTHLKYSCFKIVWLKSIDYHTLIIWGVSPHIHSLQHSLSSLILISSFFLPTLRFYHAVFEHIFMAYLDLLNPLVFLFFPLPPYLIHPKMSPFTFTFYYQHHRHCHHHHNHYRSRFHKWVRICDIWLFELISLNIMIFSSSNFPANDMISCFFHVCVYICAYIYVWYHIFFIYSSVVWYLIWFNNSVTVSRVL
jgi:hypothetical protein